MKALIYARQSSGKDDFSESVDAQIANCKKLAAKEKLEVIGVYKVAMVKVMKSRV